MIDDSKELLSDSSGRSQRSGISAKFMEKTTTLKCCCFFFDQKTPETKNSVAYRGNNKVIVSQPTAEWQVTQYNTASGIPRKNTLGEDDSKGSLVPYRSVASRPISPRTHKSSQETYVCTAPPEGERLMRPTTSV